MKGFFFKRNGSLFAKALCRENTGDFGIRVNANVTIFRAGQVVTVSELQFPHSLSSQEC